MMPHHNRGIYCVNFENSFRPEWFYIAELMYHSCPNGIHGLFFLEDEPCPSCKKTFPAVLKLAMKLGVKDG